MWASATASRIRPVIVLASAVVPVEPVEPVAAARCQWQRRRQKEEEKEEQQAQVGLSALGFWVYGSGSRVYLSEFKVQILRCT